MKEKIQQFNENRKNGTGIIRTTITGFWVIGYILVPAIYATINLYFDSFDKIQFGTMFDRWQGTLETIMIMVMTYYFTTRQGEEFKTKQDAKQETAIQQAKKPEISAKG